MEQLAKIVGGRFFSAHQGELVLHQGVVDQM
jgi:hypothetical protein